MSLYSQILTQVQTAVGALVTAGALTGSPNVVSRKRFVVLDNDVDQDTFPLIVISPLEEQEIGEDGTEQALFLEYPVFIGIAMTPGSELDGAQENLMLTYREAIRLKLRNVNIISLGTAFCTNVRADLRPAFDRPSSRLSLDTSAMIITYDIQEPRN